MCTNCRLRAGQKLFSEPFVEVDRLSISKNKFLENTKQKAKQAGYAGPIELLSPWRKPDHWSIEKPAERHDGMKSP